MALSDFLTGIIQKLISLLPADPFIETINSINYSWVGWLNWFIPVGIILTIMAAWIAAITIWYIWQALARWLKLIQ